MKNAAVRHVVEKRGLEACRICAGAVDQHVEEHLRCECAERVAHLAARAARMAYDKSSASYAEDSDRLAP